MSILPQIFVLGYNDGIGKTEVTKPIRINLRRAVVRADFIQSSEHSKVGQRALFLECGHVLFQAGRTPVPKKAHCVECKRIYLGLAL